MKQSEQKSLYEFDVIVIGGGPSGLAAAVWCSELGMSVLVAEKESEAGGQLRKIYGPVSNYIGIRAANGAEVAELFEREAAGRDIELRTNFEASEIDREHKRLRFTNGESAEFGVLIVAGGVRRRTLGLDGEKLLGMMNSGVGERESAAGERVVIVGGGDAALENACILAGVAGSVVVVHRSDEFRARREFVEAARNAANIELITNSVVTEISGDGKIESVTAKNVHSGERRTIEATRVLVRIGVEPNTEILRGIVEMDEAGYVSVDAESRTSIPYIFAVGDAANPTSPTISTAAGTGSTAAKAAYEYLRNERRK